MWCRSLAGVLLASLLSCAAWADENRLDAGAPKPGRVEIRSNDVYLSQQEVRATLTLFNGTGRDTAINLPIVVSNVSPWQAERSAFSLTVDGQPRDVRLSTTAYVGGRDVSDMLNANSIPLSRIGTDEPGNFVKLLSPRKIDELLAQGVVRRQGPDGFAPLWVVTGVATVRLAMPVDATTVVAYRYRPEADLAYYADAATSPWADGANERFCIDKAFLQAAEIMRRKMPANARGVPAPALRYAYPPEMAAMGPVGDFRFVIDKGRPETHASFCGGGAKKIGPTQFEVRRRNVTPVGDFDVQFLSAQAAP